MARTREGEFAAGHSTAPAVTWAMEGRLADQGDLLRAPEPGQLLAKAPITVTPAMGAHGLSERGLNVVPKMGTYAEAAPAEKTRVVVRQDASVQEQEQHAINLAIPRLTSVWLEALAIPASV